MLTLTIIASAFFIGGNAFSAASTAKKKPTYKAGTTYRVRYTAQKEGSMTAYMSGRNLYAKYGSKKAVKTSVNVKNSTVKIKLTGRVKNGCFKKDTIDLFVLSLTSG